MGTPCLMRCPTCGHQTVVLASGGHLTCTWRECPEPTVDRAVSRLVEQVNEFKALRAKVDTIARLLTPPQADRSLDVDAPTGTKATMDVIRPADILRPSSRRELSMVPGGLEHEPGGD